MIFGEHATALQPYVENADVMGLSLGLKIHALTTSREMTDPADSYDALTSGNYNYKDIPLFEPHSMVSFGWP